MALNRTHEWEKNFPGTGMPAKSKVDRKRGRYWPLNLKSATSNLEAGKVVSLTVVGLRERERGEDERADEKRETKPTTMEHEGGIGTQRMNDGSVDFVADVGGCGAEQRSGREDLDVCLSIFYSGCQKLIGSGYLGRLLTWHPRARKVFLHEWGTSNKYISFSVTEIFVPKA
ncbi:unnamed protein product [Prunus armeniaca]